MKLPKLKHNMSDLKHKEVFNQLQYDIDKRNIERYNAMSDENKLKYDTTIKAVQLFKDAGIPCHIFALQDVNGEDKVLQYNTMSVMDFEYDENGVFSDESQERVHDHYMEFYTCLFKMIMGHSGEQIHVNDIIKIYNDVAVYNNKKNNVSE
tara:strand:+ start:99065 stop:99517 length:453 start_codon:yes stop_codon:yes gene_type:complete